MKDRDIVLEFKNDKNETISSFFFSSKFYSYKMPIDDELIVLERKIGRHWRYRYKGFVITKNKIRFFVK